jgi:anaerobic selenocysteine-containing dehydrogenase
MLEAWRPTVRNVKAHGHMRRGQPHRWLRMVRVDTRFSITAAKADEWVPIRPGTDGALALGIAYVIINEELYDKDFVAQRTFGFEDWTDEELRQVITDGVPGTTTPSYSNKLSSKDIADIIAFFRSWQR